MAGHRIEKPARRPGTRRASVAPRRGNVVTVEAPRVLDERTPVARRRPKSTQNPRADLTRVAGPIRVVLEPMLWVCFITGVFWTLVVFDPALRQPEPGVVVYRYALPLAIIVGALLLISSISALMWLGTSTSATKARASFAGLGMLTSGWLFAKVHPVDSADFQGAAWLSVALGVLLVAICSVQWPTQPAARTRRPGVQGWLVVLALSFLLVLTGAFAWEAARQGLIGSSRIGQQGIDALPPVLTVMALLLAAIRVVLRRPLRTDDA